MSTASVITLTGLSVSEERLRAAFLMVQSESLILLLVLSALDYFPYFHSHGMECSFLYRKRLLVGWNLFSFFVYLLFCMPLWLAIQNSSAEYRNSFGIFLIETIFVRLLLSVIISVRFSMTVALALGFGLICISWILNPIIPEEFSLFCNMTPAYLSMKWYFCHMVEIVLCSLILGARCKDHWGH